jgi:hypothetical protein
MNSMPNFEATPGGGEVVGSVIYFARLSISRPELYTLMVRGLPVVREIFQVVRLHLQGKGLLRIHK